MKTILLSILTAFLLMSCGKEEDGNGIRSYEVTYQLQCNDTCEYSFNGQQEAGLPVNQSMILYPGEVLETTITLQTNELVGISAQLMDQSATGEVKVIIDGMVIYQEKWIHPWEDNDGCLCYSHGLLP